VRHINVLIAVASVYSALTTTHGKESVALLWALALGNALLALMPKEGER
jgi:hypothetical protein